MVCLACNVPLYARLNTIMDSIFIRRRSADLFYPEAQLVKSKPTEGKQASRNQDVSVAPDPDRATDAG